jgi:ribose-phosphate pyrophosphokinase
VLSGPAVARINSSVLERVVVTDTIPLRAEARSCERLDVVSVAGMFGDAMRAIHHNDSVSRLFV